MFRPIAKTLVLFALPLALVACSAEDQSPFAPHDSADDVEILVEADTFENRPDAEPQDALSTLDSQRIARTNLGNPARYSMHLKNVPGAMQPLWAHVDGQGNVIRPYPSFQAAYSALQDVPVNRPRHISAGIDYSDARSVLPVIDAIQQVENAQGLVQFEIQDLMSRFENDRGSLSRVQQAWIVRYYQPHQQTLESLQTLEDAIAGAGSDEASLGRFLGIFTALWGALTGEDNRFDDHDGDGTPNVRDDDYEGTLWRNGMVGVDGGGENSEIVIGGCFDPCPPGVGEWTGCL